MTANRSLSLLNSTRSFSEKAQWLKIENFELSEPSQISRASSERKPRFRQVVYIVP